MYSSFFGFKENPFNLTPDPRYLFLSPYHKEALDHLLYGINERKGFVTIIGGIGTGKTTLCRALLSHLDPSTRSALIFNAYVTDMELLKAVNQEFGIPMDPSLSGKKDYIDALNRFLLDTFRQGGNALLLIDEAQNLSHTVLEQIRMLSNLETEREKLLQIVIVGQSELKEVLNAPALKQLNERITVRYELKPLEPKDIQGYVTHRMVVAGGMGNIRFTKGALKKIFTYSKGNPRRINAVCDRALLIAFAQERYAISGAMIEKAIEELQGILHASGNSWSWGKIASVAALLIFMTLLAGFAGWSAREQLLVKASRVVSLPTLNTQSPIREEAPLYLDEKTSIAGLFELFRQRAKGKGDDKGYDQPLTLISFTLGAEYQVMIKKSFRILYREPGQENPPEPRYLLIRETTETGAILIDKEGKTREISRDFMLSHWGEKVSCVYPLENSLKGLKKGISSPEVLRIQGLLQDLGYMVKMTGNFDDPTHQAIMKFQRELGLEPDGIVGQQTMSILYQMTP